MSFRAAAFTGFALALGLAGAALAQTRDSSPWRAAKRSAT